MNVMDEDKKLRLLLFLVTIESILTPSFYIGIGLTVIWQVRAAIILKNGFPANALFLSFVLGQIVLLLLDLLIESLSKDTNSGVR